MTRKHYSTGPGSSDVDLLERNERQTRQALLECTRTTEILENDGRCNVVCDKLFELCVWAIYGPTAAPVVFRHRYRMVC